MVEWIKTKQSIKFLKVKIANKNIKIKIQITEQRETKI